MMRRLATTAALLATTGGLAACGGEHEPVTRGETEGVYVEAGELKYQVQISRILNENDPEDRAYVAGIADPLERELGKDEEWFGVFLRVENEHDEPHIASSSIEIDDTTGAKFEPVELDPEANPLAYEGGPLQGGRQIPDTESVTRSGPTQGALILFKIPRANLENRPLELKIESGGEEALVDLDV